MTLFIHIIYFLSFLHLSLSASVPHSHDDRGLAELTHFPRESTLSVPSVSRDLRHLVSNKTAIFGPDDDRWENATERYTSSSVPDVQLIVRPGLEADVPIIVKYCNAHSIPFLAVNRGHAVTSDVGKFRGIQIDLASLRNYTITPDKKSAWFQGGSYGGSVIHSLWERGFVVTTGSCTCVGLLGAGLGGGHGRLEGQYGLVSDNLLNINLVLANGSSIRVNATSHPDLWWGMQGAGHNFGIVTSFEMKIHPREVETWHYRNYVWEGKELERVFGALNEFHGYGEHGEGLGSTPVKMGNEFGHFMMNTTLRNEPVLSWTFAYAGPNTTAETYLAPFNSIPHLSTSSGDVPYPQIPEIQGTGLTSPACNIPNNNWAFSTVNLLRYNITTERTIYEHFKQNAALYPELAAGAAVVHEGYANEAVKKADVTKAAFAYRGENHLMYAGIIIPPNSTTEISTAAWAWANEVKDLWNAGQPDRVPTTYINYAVGGESVESVYGEDWRVDRLQGLKRRYDPENRFRYYNPLVRD